MRVELHSVENGLGEIDVRGSDGDALVLSRDRPIALNWSDCSGSIMQYLVRAGELHFEAELAALRYVLEGNVGSSVSLGEQLHLFLRLLASGDYRLEDTTFEFSDSRQCDANWDEDADYDLFYPFDTTLVLTRPTSTLNTDQIEHFERLIGSGRQPVALAVTVEEAYCAYVVDGHHKLAAYQRLEKEPRVITAYRLSAPPLEQDTFSTYFSPGHPLASHFRKVH